MKRSHDGEWCLGCCSPGKWTNPTGHAPPFPDAGHPIVVEVAGGNTAAPVSVQPVAVDPRLSTGVTVVESKLTTGVLDRPSVAASAAAAAVAVFDLKVCESS